MNLNFDKIKLEELAEQNEIKFVVLFGSRASNRQREGSDFDIAVLTTAEKTIGKSLDSYNNVLFGLARVLDIPDHKIDLTNLNNASPFLKYNVVSGGKLLYGDTRRYNLFKLYSIRSYQENIAIQRLRDIMIERRMNDLKEKYVK